MSVTLQRTRAKGSPDANCGAQHTFAADEQVILAKSDQLTQQSALVALRVRSLANARRFTCAAGARVPKPMRHAVRRR